MDAVYRGFAAVQSVALWYWMRSHVPAGLSWSTPAPVDSPEVDVDGGGGGPSTAAAETTAAGALYTSSIASNIALSLAVFGLVRVAKHYALSRASQLHTRALVQARVRAALARWEGPCLAEVAQCLAIPHPAESSPISRDTLVRVMGGGHEEGVDAVLMAWEAMAATAATASVERLEVPAEEGVAEGAVGHASSGVDEEGVQPQQLAFHGIVPSITYASGFPLVTLLELCRNARWVLTLEEDRRLLRRLECVVRLALFRRVAMVEEVCYHAHLWRRTVLLHGSAAADGPCAAAPPLRRGRVLLHAWRVYGRPTWLVPYTPSEQPPLSSLSRPGSTAFAATTTTTTTTAVATCLRHYLCLPHSYFPLEALLAQRPHWMEEEVLAMVAEWDARCRDNLRRAAAELAELGAGSAPRRSLLAAEARQTAAQAAVDLWFTLYTAPLIVQYAAAVAEYQRGSYAATLLRGVTRWVGRGPDELLFDCGAHTVSRERPTSPYGVTAYFCEEAVQRAVRVRLVAYTALNAALSLLRLSPLQGHFSAVLSAITVSLVRQSWTAGEAAVPPSSLTPPLLSSDMATTSSPGADGYSHSGACSATVTPTPTTAHCDATLEFATRLFLRATLAMSLSRLIQMVVESVYASLEHTAGPLFAEEVAGTIAHMDDAVYERAVDPDGTSGARHGTVFRKREATERDYRVAPPTGRDEDSRYMVSHAADAVRRWVGLVVELSLVVWRGDLPLYTISSLVQQFHDSDTSLLDTLGLTMPWRVERGLWRYRADPIPRAAPVGLRLLLELLAEGGEQRPSMEAVDGSAPLRSPFLALVVCAAVQSHGPLCTGSSSGSSGGSDGDDDGGASMPTEDAATAQRTAQRAYAVRRLYDAVLSYPFPYALLSLRRDRLRAEGWVMDAGSSRGRPPRSGSWPLASVVARWRLRARRGAGGVVGARALAVVEALREDAAFVRSSEVGAVCAAAEAALVGDDTCPVGNAMAGPLAGGRQVPEHPTLDPVEVATVRSKGYRRYLPANLSSYDLFTPSARFIFRQLGLELVLANHVLDLEERMQGPVDPWDLTGLFEDADSTPIASLLRLGVHLCQSLAVVALTCTRLTRSGLVMAPRPAWEVLERCARVGAYQGLYSILSAWPSPLHEWPHPPFLHQAPSTISDLSAYAQCTVVRARRRAWRVSRAPRSDPLPPPQRQEVAPSPAGWSAPDLLFDEADRIAGGLRLYTGLDLHKVYFAYPQLHHTLVHGAGDGQVRGDPQILEYRQPVVNPTLKDVSIALPAAGMSAIVGRTGSGKSSLMKLLRRCYDPLALVAVVWPVAPGHAVGESRAVVEEWSETLLCRVLWLQWIENPLPLPAGVAETAEAETGAKAESSSTTTRHTPHAYLPTPSYLTLDGVPVSCFRTSYLRRWLAHLEQAPLILNQLSFADNIRFLSRGVTDVEVRQSAELCQCEEFIRARAGGLNTVVGTLSGGERQRLALARVVAGVRARVRQELRGRALPSHGDCSTPTGAGSCSVTPVPPPTAAVEGCLLLDEPTSRLDAYNELEVQRAIHCLLPSHKARSRGEGETGDALPSLMVVTIAHRMSTLREAAYMVVLEGGRVTCAGPAAYVRAHSAFVQQQMRLQSVTSHGSMSDADPHGGGP